ncbi:MAG: MDR family MFS transporter [Bellilinea sp.]
MLTKLSKIYNEFPRKFWVVVGVSFIDGVGGTLLFPFFALYITGRFNVGMTEAGLILGIFSIFGLFGGMIGGGLADRYGRRSIIIIGLVFSALSTLTLGLVDKFTMLIPLAVVIGLLFNFAGPAHSAMVADLLPEKQRQEGFGILRVVGNMAWIVGPSIGGFVAKKSFFALFIMDAIVSCVVALLFFLFIPETKPVRDDIAHKAESLLETFRGYGQVMRDSAYVWFLLAGILMGLVYQQMYHSLSVFLRDSHGIEPQGYGFLLTTSAITVILFQFTVTRLIKRRPPFLMMGFGTLFYVVGFSMFGWAATYWLFMLAIVIITVGEMIVIPTSQALAANFAPEEMRGRYMAAFSLLWMIPSTLGPGAAGYILDNYNPNWLWYIGGVVCAVAALLYVIMHNRLGGQQQFAPAPDEAGI